MPTPAKKLSGGKKRGPSKSPSPAKKATSSKKAARPSLPSSSKSKSPQPPPTKRPRGRPRKDAVVSLFDPRLPPPPPPPPPMNNPFYQKFVTEYWQNNYFYHKTSGQAMTNIWGMGKPMLFPEAAPAEGKPTAAVAAEADGGDVTESTTV